ncbi:unnamed protein product [Colias eurytheme]|nr:unnamed protein product [Colias eurytheme]
MDTNDELAQLEELLSADLNEESCDKNVKESIIIKEVDIFKNTSNEKVDESIAVESSVIHNGDTDSSDDEEKRNYTERKYSQYGALVKKSLDHKEHEQIDKRIEFESRLRQTNIELKVAKQSSFKKTPESSSEQSNKQFFGVPESKKNCLVMFLRIPYLGFV